MTKYKSALAVILLFLTVLLIPGAVHAEPETSGDVSVDRKDSVDSRFSTRDSEESSTSGAAGPAPKNKVTTAPICDVLQPTITEVDPGMTCEAAECPGGATRYLQITEVPGESPDTEIFCGAPDTDIASLAIDEFYTNTVTVSTPSIKPDATTLVNFPNIYWSDVTAYVEPTGITVADVDIKFIPVSYRWNFGHKDTKAITTTDPGKPYDPRLTQTMSDVEANYTNTFSYSTTGDFETTLTVVFNGQYSVNGGDWVDIPGSLTATSPPHPLAVYEARAELILPERN